MIQKKFGLAIKKLREETGLSQEKFALSIGMDRTYYASVEAGKRNISLQNIYKITMVTESISNNNLSQEGTVMGIDEITNSGKDYATEYWNKEMRGKPADFEKLKGGRTATDIQNLNQFEEKKAEQVLKGDQKEIDIEKLKKFL